MSNRKTLKVILLISLIFAAFVSANIYANTPKNKESKFVLKPKDAVTNNKTVKERLKESKDFDDKLGGQYLDKEGKLHINFVGDVESIPKELKLESVEYHSVKHTLKELNDIMDFLNNNHEEFRIMAAGLDEKNNKIIVELAKMDSKIIEKINKMVNPSALEIKQRDPNMQTVFTTSDTK